MSCMYYFYKADNLHPGVVKVFFCLRDHVGFMFLAPSSEAVHLVYGSHHFV